MTGDFDDNYGHGFHGFQTRIEVVTAALGGGKNVRKAVAEDFKDALRRQQESHRRDPYDWPDWTAASEIDFDHTGWSSMRRLQNEPKEPLLASADWNGVKLEFRREIAHIAGGGFWFTVGLISQHKQHDHRKHEDVIKYGPFITDHGAEAAHGSRYSHEQKSTNATTPAGASASLRKLIEKHFKVTFVDVAKVAA
jgi:hypothetical protein